MKYVEWETIAFIVLIGFFIGGAGFLIWEEQDNRHNESIACIKSGKQVFQGDCITGFLP